MPGRQQRNSPPVPLLCHDYYAYAARSSSINDVNNETPTEDRDEEQETMDREEGSGSPTSSVVDQIKVMQENMSQLLQKAVQEDEEGKKKTACHESSLAEMQKKINDLQKDKNELEAKVVLLETQKSRHLLQATMLKMDKEALQDILYSSAYPLRNRRRYWRSSPDSNGCALIINNIHFTTPEMKKRTGAEGDTQKLKAAFQSLPLRIEVKTHENLDLSTMPSVLQEEANRDHTDEDFFICCIMSHGTQGKVFATNGFGVDILDILSLFNGKRCPSLMGKPKLFFIQACQGDKDQTLERAGDPSDAKPSPSPILAYLSTEADFFLALATVPGYVAYRGEDGADFVNVLAKVLTEHGKSQDLMSMMAMVSRELNETYNYSPFCCTTLRHKMLFNHKPIEF